MKTIEEAAKTFADKEYEIGQVDWDALYKGYYHGMKDLLNKPLSERITAEEREKIKGIYKDELEAANEHKRQANSSMNRTCKEWHNSIRESCHGRLFLLESIFGKSMFAEEGGEK